MTPTFASMFQYALVTPCVISLHVYHSFLSFLFFGILVGNHWPATSAAWCGDAAAMCCVEHHWTLWCTGRCISVMRGASVDCVVHHWTVGVLDSASMWRGASVDGVVHQWIVGCTRWCISVLFGASVDYVVYRMVHQCSGWCISVLCGASVDCVVYWIVHQ